jgi:hypothetical protein
MQAAEVEARSAATIRARRDDAAVNGLYYQVWQHLCRKGRVVPSGDRAGLAAEMCRIRRQNQAKARET